MGWSSETAGGGRTQLQGIWAEKLKPGSLRIRLASVCQVLAPPGACDGVGSSFLGLLSGVRTELLSRERHGSVWFSQDRKADH